MSKHYRKIWSDHYGPIPRDENGLSYEIHHIDGDPTNNDITNLLCVTIQEHYDIHYTQGDTMACLAIEIRMGISSDEKSKIASMTNSQRMQDGTHPFLQPTFINPFAKRPDGTSIQTDRVKAGTHHFIGGEIQRQAQNRLVAAGMHHNQNGESARRQVLNGTHGSQLFVTCLGCRETHTKMIYARDHGAKCHLLTGSKSVVINGNRYESIKIAAAKLNITEHQAKVLAKGKIPRPAVEVNGVVYKSVNAAIRETGLSRVMIEKTGKFIRPEFFVDRSVSCCHSKSLL